MPVEQIETERKTKFAPLVVTVTISVAKSGAFEKVYSVDFNNFKQTEWLRKLLVWAFFNGRSVDIRNAKDQPQ